MAEDKKVDIKNEDDEHIEWQICCSKSSKAFIKYLTTVCICMVVLIFSIIMVVTNPDKDNSIYFSLMSSIITLFIPAPTIEKVN